MLSQMTDTAPEKRPTADQILTNPALRRMALLRPMISVTLYYFTINVKVKTSTFSLYTYLILLIHYNYTLLSSETEKY